MSSRKRKPWEVENLEVQTKRGRKVKKINYIDDFLESDEEYVFSNLNEYLTKL